jgi:DNA-binding response OmpR family regulator
MKVEMKRILVADDDRQALMLMEAALRVAGFQVTMAADGEAALASFRQQGHDLVMLDIDMPGRNGLDVCRELRAEAGELLPIVMVTGMDDVESVDAAYEAGATDFISKPICCAATRSTSTSRQRARTSGAWRTSTA